jgi:hypothetical protein
MRQRERILQSLESVYREAFQAASERKDRAEMARLDFEYQRDQLRMEVLLDLRDMLTAPAASESEKGGSILDKAQALKQLTRLR